MLNGYRSSLQPNATQDEHKIPRTSGAEIYAVSTFNPNLVPFVKIYLIIRSNRALLVKLSICRWLKADNHQKQ